MTAVASTPIQIGQLQDQLSGTPRSGLIDRWIYVFTAGVILTVVLTGFVPDSVRLIAAVQSGERPPLPPVLHVHAILMGSFLALMLTQTILVAIGRVDLHRKLGRIAFVLAPALVVVGFLLVPVSYHYHWHAAQVAPPAVRQKLMHPFVWDIILLAQIQVGLFFSIFTTIGLWARRSNPGLHKRMMLIAPAMALGPAFSRMTWLPQIPFIFPLLVLVPMFIWDVKRNRRVHPAYLILLAVYLPASMFFPIAVRSPWWQGIAHRIMGV
ncbi:MAG TPA: hypothetical protein VGQ34_01460 [Sphingomicrobium sp.]|jgi:hypothetical protein|nr:hypothetical protein [Sphingomicrobium sp.]